MLVLMTNIAHGDEARARKRAYDREKIAAKRAAMTPEERAEARRQHDAAYRARHREERRAYDREYRKRRSS